MKQCAVLFVNVDPNGSEHVRSMRTMGFLVDEVKAWPSDETVRKYHVLVVHVPAAEGAPMLAARLRAKPHFGRRLLVALVPCDTPPALRRAAEAGGFDDVIEERCDTRHLTTRILRGLRTRSELRCVLPPAAGRPAA